MLASELMVVDAPEMFMAGESYELVFERRDANGYIGFVSPSIHARLGFFWWLVG